MHVEHQCASKKALSFRIASIRMYFLYLLQCKDGTIYTGITTDVVRRFEEHKSGTGGHYTRAKGAAKMLYSENHKNRSSASKREAEIKKWTRKQKLAFVRSASRKKHRNQKVI